MGSKIRITSLRKLIRESMSYGHLLYEGKAYVNLHDRHDLLRLDLVVLFYPPDEEVIEEWRRKSQEYEEVYEMSRSISDTGWDSYGRAAKTARNKLDAIGKTGKIDYMSCIVGQDYIIEATIGDVKIRADNSCFWHEVETSTPDWRPDETLPEDHYAL